MTNLKNSSQESKTQGLNLNSKEFKTMAKEVYLASRLEDFEPPKLTIIDYNTTNGKVQCIDDLFQDQFQLTLDELYKVHNEPYVIDKIGSFDGDCFGTVIEQMYLEQPTKLAILCAYAYYYSHLIETFEDHFEQVLGLYQQNPLQRAQHKTIHHSIQMIAIGA